MGVSETLYSIKTVISTRDILQLNYLGFQNSIYSIFSECNVWCVIIEV